MGGRLVRTADAFGTMRRALDGDLILEGPHKENASSELRHLEEDAENALRLWQRKHGIIEERVNDRAGTLTRGEWSPGPKEETK